MTAVNRTIITKSVEIHKIQSIIKLSQNQNCRLLSLRTANIDNNTSYASDSLQHPIISILRDCKTLKDCYEKIRNKNEYISLLNSDNSTYSYQHHKYFLLELIDKASKDKYLSWQMICNIIEFYSKHKAMYNVSVESIHNFLSILSRRGDFNAVSSIIERLISHSNENNDNTPILSINNRLFIVLIQSLRIGGQCERGYNVFEQALNEFNIPPSIPLLLQAYMCNPTKWNFNFVTLLNEYNLQCDQSAYNEVIKFHLQCIVNQCEKSKHLSTSQRPITFEAFETFEFDDINQYKNKLPSNIVDEYNATISAKQSQKTNITQETILSSIQLHAQRILFYLNDANSSNYYLNTDIFHKIIATSFDYMFHNKLPLTEWMNKYIKHIITKQFQNHNQALTNLLPLLFQGCLNRNQVQLSRDIWQLCETNNIEIDKESNKYYNDLCIRHFVRHGKTPPNDNHKDQNPELKLCAFPGDAHSHSHSLQTAAPQTNDECLKLANNLLDRSHKIGCLMDSYYNDAMIAKELEPHSKKLFLTDMENAITFCRKYNDIISGRILFDAFLASKLSFKYHAAMSTDFLFLLDNKHCRHENNSFGITPRDVITLWPLNPPQAFINKAFTVLITYKNAVGIKKLFDTVTLQNTQNQKQLLLTPKMLILASDLFATECGTCTDNIYWDYLWRLMENKQFKSARTTHSVGYIGNKILNIVCTANDDEWTEDELMVHVKRIYNTFKNYSLPLPLPLMQKLHSKLTNALNKSWIRTVYIDEHHPNTNSSMHIMNDYRWYIDSESFNYALEHGLYGKLAPLRKLMIDGTIPTSHRLVHRILLTFSRSNELDIAHLQQFLIECQAHYQHAFSPKEKSLIAQMVKRYITDQNINMEHDAYMSAMIAYLKSIKVIINMNEVAELQQISGDTRRTVKPYIKFINPQRAEAPTSDAIRFEVGETVQLCGLAQYAYLNGSIGRVVGWFNKDNRTYPVQLNDNPHAVYVSARNMRFGKHIINTTLPEFEGDGVLETSDVTLILPSPDIQTSAAPATITPFDIKQRKHHLRNKLLHIFEDQKADTFENGISLVSFKQLWNLYFPDEEFYHDDESLHDYVVMHVPLEVDYGWNVLQYPVQPLERIYYLTKYSFKPKWDKLLSLDAFLAYLRNLIENQANGRIRLKDLCTACYSDVYESHKHIRSYLCVNMLHFLKHHHNEFVVYVINGEKYISLYSNANGDKTDNMNGNMCQWNVYEVQYWLWKLYHDTKCNNNVTILEWNVILALFEGHHIDGNALNSLNDSDLSKMNINSIGIQKLILSSIQKESSVDTVDDDEEEPLFTIRDNCVPLKEFDVLCDDNFYECLINYHNKSPSDDNYIYQHDILRYYDINEQHQWFMQHLVNCYYDKFHVKYYLHNDKHKYLKINMREQRTVSDIDDAELQKRLKTELQQHPIGIDLISLLHEYELKYNGKMFKHNAKYVNLTDRLKALNFIVTSSSCGYIVFDFSF